MIYHGDPKTVAAYRVLGLQETVGPSNEERVAQLTSLLRTLMFDQTRRLRYGEQRATAFLPGSLEAVPAPPEWWEGVSVDRVANTATANGTTLNGLLIYAGDVAAAEDQQATGASELPPVTASEASPIPEGLSPAVAPEASLPEAPPSVAASKVMSHSGFPGAPSTRHIIEDEMRRRARAGELFSKLEDEVAHLCAWFDSQEEFKNLARAKEKSLITSLRPLFEKLKAG
jgi:hypothetical protein